MSEDKKNLNDEIARLISKHGSLDAAIDHAKRKAKTWESLKNLMVFKKAAGGKSPVSPLTAQLRFPHFATGGLVTHLPEGFGNLKAGVDAAGWVHDELQCDDIESFLKFFSQGTTSGQWSATGRMDKPKKVEVHQILAVDRMTNDIEKVRKALLRMIKPRYVLRPLEEVCVRNQVLYLSGSGKEWKRGRVIAVASNYLRIMTEEGKTQMFGFATLCNGVWVRKTAPFPEVVHAKG